VGNAFVRKSSRHLIAVAAVLAGTIGPAAAADVGVLYGVRSVNQQYSFRTIDFGGSGTVRELGVLAQPTGERVSAIFQNQDRGIGLILTSVREQATRRALIRMVGTPERLVDASLSEITSLASAYSVSSIVVLISGLPISLISHYSDTPPFWLGNVNLTSGQVTMLSLALEANRRYGDLTQCPDGSIYAISRAPQWDVRLVRIDLSRRAATLLVQPMLNGAPMYAELSSLTCSPAGQLYGLADPGSSGINSIFAIDLNTGALTRIREFDVDRMLFVR